MKKMILIVAFVITGVMVNAQEKDAYTKDTEKLVQVISESAFEPAIEQFKAMVADDKKEAFEKDVRATFPSLYEAMAKIYKEEFTHKEVKDILAFYATPTGKKMAEKAGILSQKGMAAGQQWGMKIQTLMAKYKKEN